MPTSHVLSNIVSFVSKKWFLVRIRVLCIAVDVFQGIIVGTWMNMALVVPYSLLVLGRAQMPTSHVLSQIVSSITGSIGNLADSTCTYSKGCGSAIIRGE
jgi:hypothetical protein